MTLHRLGFSTLGAPGASANEVVDLAHRGGFEAVEVRIGDDEPIGLHTTTDSRARWRSAFEVAGVRILSVNSYLTISSINPAVPQELDALIQLAGDLGAGGVRLLVGDESHSALPLSPGELRSVQLLEAAAPMADRTGVDLLLETHDSHPTAERMLRILDAFESPVSSRCVRVIWDSVHSWCAGEKFTKTRDALKNRLAWVQVKDVASRQEPTPVALGTGEFPIGDLCAALPDDTLLVLEWERRWHPELPPLEDALTQLRPWLRQPKGATL